MIKDLATLKYNNDNGIMKDENGNDTAKITLIHKINDKRSQINTFKRATGYTNVDIDGDVKKMIEKFNKQKSSTSGPPAPNTSKKNPSKRIYNPDELKKVSKKEAEQEKQRIKDIQRKMAEAKARTKKQLEDEKKKSENEEYNKLNTSVNDMIKNNFKDTKQYTELRTAILCDSEQCKYTLKKREELGRKLVKSYNLFKKKEEEKSIEELKKKKLQKDEGIFSGINALITDFKSNLSKINSSTKEYYIEQQIQNINTEIKNSKRLIETSSVKKKFNTKIIEFKKYSALARQKIAEFRVQKSIKKIEEEKKKEIEAKNLAIQKQKRIAEIERNKKAKQAAMKKAFEDKKRAEEALKKKNLEDKKKRAFEAAKKKAAAEALKLQQQKKLEEKKKREEIEKKKQKLLKLISPLSTTNKTSFDVPNYKNKNIVQFPKKVKITVMKTILKQIRSSLNDIESYNKDDKLLNAYKLALEKLEILMDFWELLGKKRETKQDNTLTSDEIGEFKEKITSYIDKVRNEKSNLTKDNDGRRFVQAHGGKFLMGNLLALLTKYDDKNKKEEEKKQEEERKKMKKKLEDTYSKSINDIALFFNDSESLFHDDIFNKLNAKTN